MRFRVLGPMRVWHDGEWATIRAAQPRVVLAILLTEAGRVVSADRLVDELWGDRPPRTALNTIQGYIARLRKLLGDGPETRVLTRDRGYVLEVADGGVDSQVFERLVESGQRSLAGGQLSAAVEQLVEALALWQGPAMHDALASPMVMAEANRLEQRRLTALEARLGAELALGRHGAAVDELSLLVEGYPLREKLRCQLMLALYRCGRRAEALDVYRNGRAVLVAELGVEPGTELRELERAILADDRSLAGGTASARVTPAQVPADVAGFTGRHGFLRQLDGMLPAVAIVAIAGTPGVGKTALAVHWAHRVRDRFGDGQLYVNLRGYATGPPVEPIDALARFLHALGVPAEQVPTDVEEAAALYRSLLADRRILVVLDNAHDSEQVRPLLPGAPGCAVVVTSRHQLPGLVAEGAHPMQLDVLSPSEARQLLASRLGGNRILAEPIAVDEIVNAAAGLPLGLAIVAARAATYPTFPLASVAQELRDAGSLSAFAGLNAANDIRTVFSWSYRTISDGAARIFRMLGISPGRDVSTLAAASLAALPVDHASRLLTELAGSHLITEYAPGRYIFHDLLRRYAIELGRTHDSETQRHVSLRRLLGYYLHTAHKAESLLAPGQVWPALEPPEPGVTSADPADHRKALVWLTAERGNLMAAVELAASAGFGMEACQLASILAAFLVRQGHWHDGLRVQQVALEAAQRLGVRKERAEAHRVLANIYRHLHRFDDARIHFWSALDLFVDVDDRAGRAHTHLGIARMFEGLGCYQEALDHDGRAVDLFRAVGHRTGLAAAVNSVGWTHALLGDYQHAIAHCRDALALQGELGDRKGKALTLDSLGYAYHHLGQFDHAASCYLQAIALNREIGDRLYEAMSLSRLGDSYHAVGDLDGARSAWQDAIPQLDQLDQSHAHDVRVKLHRLGPSPEPSTYHLDNHRLVRRPG